MEGKNIAHPFIQWVGGKRFIIKELAKRIPIEYSYYHEPFLGGGALFFYIIDILPFLKKGDSYWFTQSCVIPSVGSWAEFAN
jgi:site-specific DNA-adenine methylase